MSVSKKQGRRTPEEMIADLEAKIAEVKRRAARKKVQRDPALRQIKVALKSIDKAMVATQDVATRTALDEARSTLSACLTLHGVEMKSKSAVLFPHPRRSRQIDAGAVLEYLRAHPASRSEEIAAALGTDTKTLRPALQRLRSDDQARAQGQGRATTYVATV